jgi:predicted SnoaL-like aldol condensation-catalyzing enzyme
MQSHKEIATAFQQLVVSGKICEAYEKFVSPDFRHHNPYFKGDRESLMHGMEENAAQFPNKIFEVKRVLQDGNLVVVHSRLKLAPDMPEIATVHIFRFEGDQIAEEWDVNQQASGESQNENGMF